QWTGHEEERLALLRQGVISKADYVEIELDVADQIRPLPPTKRGLAYTNLLDVPDNLKEIYQQALTKNPDVSKLVVPAPSPGGGWAGCPDPGQAGGAHRGRGGGETGDHARSTGPQGGSPLGLRGPRTRDGSLRRTVHRLRTGSGLPLLQHRPVHPLRCGDGLR